MEEASRDAARKTTHCEKLDYFRKAKEFQEYRKGEQEDEEEDVICLSLTFDYTVWSSRFLILLSELLCLVVVD